MGEFLKNLLEDKKMAKMGMSHKMGNKKSSNNTNGKKNGKKMKMPKNKNSKGGMGY